METVTKPIRVLHSVSLMNRGGQETLLMNIYRSINREKVQFDFQCTNLEKGDYDDEIISLGGKILYLTINPLKKIKYLKYLGDIWTGYRFFKQNPGYDFYHIHTYHAFGAFLSIVSAKLARVKNIILHSHNSNAPHPALHKIFRPFLSLFKIERFACSNLAAKWMFGDKSLEKAKVKIIKNGINTSEFIYNSDKRIHARKELGVNNKLVIGHIGRFNYQKNHEFLIDIFKEIQSKNKDTVLLLIGRGELEDKIRKKVNFYGLDDTVIFMGIRTDIPELLQAMDLFLFPSRFEGLPVVLIETQAAGLKCIASDSITEEVMLTDLVQFIPLSKTAEEWADIALQNCKYSRVATYETIKNAGYDITYTAEWLQNFYLRKSKNLFKIS